MGAAGYPPAPNAGGANDDRSGGDGTGAVKRVVVTEFMDEAALDGFGEGFEVRYAPALVDDRAAMLDALADADAVIVRNRTQVDAELLAAAPKLRAVGRLGVGLDNIDLAACAVRGIAVHPATGANAASVAEYVIGAVMTLVRGAFHSNAAMLAAEWPRVALGRGGEVGGRTLGLVGYGTIAREVAVRASALGMTVIAHDPMLDAAGPAWGGTEPVALDALLARADAVSLHVPLTDGTRGMIDADALGRMKPGAILVNTARGGIVDEAAVAAALRSGALGGAALDVFEEEPLGEAAATFAGCPNLILTPHVAGVTAEANERVSHLTVANVRRALMAE